MAADALSRQAEDTLQQRHAAPDIAALNHEPLQRFRRHDGDEFGNFERIGGSNRVEADGRAGGRIPDQPGWQIGDSRDDKRANGYHCHGEDMTAAHGAILRRLTHAAWRSGV